MENQIGKGTSASTTPDEKKKFFTGSFNRKKQCRFCSDQEFVVDYKNTRVLQSFLTEHGKIVPRRISGNCAKHQRKMTIAVKRARVLSMLGFTTMGPSQ